MQIGLDFVVFKNYIVAAGRLPGRERVQGLQHRYRRDESFQRQPILSDHVLDYLHDAPFGRGALSDPRGPHREGFVALVGRWSQ
jgi:hypothetical protein